MWLQLCQILTDFNNFCIAETENNVQNRAFIFYELLKKSVANDAINVSLFAEPVCCEPSMSGGIGVARILSAGVHFFFAKKIDDLFLVVAV